MATECALPNTARQWATQVEEYQLSGRSIYDGGDFSSASEIKEPQYLLLRVLWKVQRYTKLFDRGQGPQDDGGKEILEVGQKYLHGLDSWKPYLTHERMHTTRKISQQLGTFSLVCYYQQLVQRRQLSEDKEYSRQKVIPLTRASARRLQATTQDGPSTPTRITSALQRLELRSPEVEPETPGTSAGSIASPSQFAALSPVSPAQVDDPVYAEAIEDEQIVNTTLILFLNALTIHFPDVKGDWTLHRKAFTFGGGSKIYEARVDGFLKKEGDEEPKVIIEVKPFIREKKPEAIRMQEAAQMAAWISHYPPKHLEHFRKQGQPMQRLLISQDRHEIYLTFGVFDADYVDYVCGRLSHTLSHLTMTEYGPFLTTDAEQLKALAYFLMGYTDECCR